MARWFRFYSDVPHDPKVWNLNPKLFRFWVGCLCLAAEHDGKLPSVSDLSHNLHLATTWVTVRCHLLVSFGLLDVQEGDTFAIHNWSKWQYVSDSSTERVRRFRESAKSADVTAVKRFRNGHETDETPPDPDPDTDTDTDTESENPPTIPLLAKPLPKPKYSTEFLEFWNRSTQRGSKLAAYKAWTKIPDLTQVSTQILTAMDSWMQESSQWKDETKQPHIATWLNRRGWEEIIPKNGATRGESRYKTKSELTEEACARVLDKLNQKNRS